MVDIGSSTRPRNWNNYDAPGSYALASRVSETVINAGDTLKFEQYITGYGEIKKCKIQCYISSDIFDDTVSTVTNSLAQRDNIELFWGARRDVIGEPGYHCTCSGLRADNWEEETLFFDAGSHGMLLSEMKVTNAPFDYSLKTRNNIKPGSHYIDFYMTYFNGEEWKTSKERVDFRVNNSFEKHSTVISLLAAAALIVTIVHDGLAPLLETIHELGKYISARH